MRISQAMIWNQVKSSSAALKPPSKSNNSMKSSTPWCLSPHLIQNNDCARWMALWLGWMKNGVSFTLASLFLFSFFLSLIDTWGISVEHLCCGSLPASFSSFLGGFAEPPSCLPLLFFICSHWCESQIQTTKSPGVAVPWTLLFSHHHQDNPCNGQQLHVTSRRDFQHKIFCLFKWNICIHHWCCASFASMHSTKWLGLLRLNAFKS